MRTRICKICLAEKPTSAYYRTGRGYPTSYCKPCHYAECRRRLGKANHARLNAPPRVVANPFIKAEERISDLHHFLWGETV
jgi:hypothetical protein